MQAQPSTPQRIIAAIRNDQELEQVISSQTQTVFLLSADLRTLGQQCDRLHQAGKHIFLHFDLVNGLKGDAAGIQFAAENFHLTGIISTKAQCLKAAQEAKLLAVLRVFVLDSSAFKTGVAHAQACKPDCVEVLPGVSTKIIRLAKQHFRLPVIAGGLIQDQEDVSLALQAGADAVSTSQPKLWI